MQLLAQVRSMVEASREAIEQPRKLLAVNDAVLTALRPSATVPDSLTCVQLDELAALITKARGGHAFVWNVNTTLPIFTSPQSTAIQ
jgi:hypothetical protein